MPIPDLTHFVTQYSETIRERQPTEEQPALPGHKPTKVAIIDDGIMLITDPSHQTHHAKAAGRVVEGRSFVFRRDEEYQWFHKRSQLFALKNTPFYLVPATKETDKE